MKFKLETPLEEALREESVILALLDSYDKGLVINATEVDAERYKMYSETRLKELREIIRKYNRKPDNSHRGSGSN